MDKLQGNTTEDSDYDSTEYEEAFLGDSDEYQPATTLASKIIQHLTKDLEVASHENMTNELDYDEGQH